MNFNDDIIRHRTRDYVDNADEIKCCDYCDTPWCRTNGYSIWWNNDCIRICDGCFAKARQQK